MSPLSSLPPAPPHPPIRVAVYDGPGISETRAKLLAALAKDPCLLLHAITPEDIRGGALTGGGAAGFDLLVHPGGSGGEQGRALEEAGRERVRAFVAGGGGFLGVCAGTYLATGDYPWSLGILNACIVDREHWARGHGSVELALTGAGRTLLGTPTVARIDMMYWQGPLLAPAHKPDLPPYTELAAFATEVRRDGVPGGVMPGTTAIAAAPYGNGRVLCFSTHPEKTPGQEPLLHHAALWAARADSPAAVIK